MNEQAGLDIHDHVRCRSNGRDKARTVPGRHTGACSDEACPGCAECPSAHCRICDRVHADGCCAECLALTRASLHDIARMVDALPEEVEHRGVNGEAMVLLGPAADPEARGHLEASVLAGRVPADYLDVADSDLHPLYVLGTYDMLWRDALEHDGDELVSVVAAVDYLDRQMTYMAGYEHLPFDEFARDVKACAIHLEAVLHDGEQVDTGAPCMSCNAPLERTWGETALTDGWRCPRCHQTSTEDQYRFAVKHLHREEAEWLSDRDMEIRTGVKAGTVRVWAQRGEVERKRDGGRTLYLVADVLERARVA